MASSTRIKERSAVAREIYESLGAGPFEMSGKVFRIVKREKEGSEAIYFFREYHTPQGVESL